MKLVELTIDNFKNNYGLKGIDYSKLDWLFVINKSLSYDVMVIVKTIDEDKIIALPLFQRSIGFLKFCGAPLSGSFTGQFDVITNIEHINSCMKDEFISEIKTYLKREWFQYIELPIYSMSCEDNKRWVGIKTRETLIVDIDNLDNTWKKISGRARTSIRKARKLEVNVDEVSNNLHLIHDFYEMYKRTFEKKRTRIPHSIELYLNICQLPYVKVYRAAKDGETIAYGIFSQFDTRLIYLAGTMTKKGALASASSLIQWHAISDAHNIGLKVYDLGGIGNSKIDKFKMSFSNSREVRNVSIHSSVIWKIVFPVASFLYARGFLKVNRR